MIVRILIGVLTMAATLATATAASAHDESKYPDWSGQWRWNAMGGGPRYDPSKPAGAAQQAPLKEEFKRIHEENMAEQAQGSQGLYAQSAKCIPMGMPFQMSIVPFPLEFIITAKTTFILFEVIPHSPVASTPTVATSRKTSRRLIPAIRSASGLTPTVMAGSTRSKWRPAICASRDCSIRPGSCFIRTARPSSRSVSTRIKPIRICCTTR